MTSGSGAGDPFEGMIRTEPFVSEPVPDVASLWDERGETAYAKSVLVCPATVTFTGKPFPSRNSAVPVIAASLGFISRISVVHPAPSLKCGTTAIAAAGGIVVSITGRVDIRKSCRSLTTPRIATTATGTLDVKLNVPWNVGPLKVLKGSLSRNLAIC